MIIFGTEYLSSDALHNMLVLGIKFFVVLTSLQIIVLVIQKLVLENARHRRLLLNDSYQIQMRQAFRQEGFLVDKPRTNVEFEVFADVCIALMSTSSSDQLELIHQTIRRFGVHEFFVSSVAHSRSWTKTYQVVEILGFLNLQELGAIFRRMLELEKVNSLVFSKLIWALSRISCERDLPVILDCISSPDFMSAKFNEYIFCNIIESFKQRGEADTLINCFKDIMDDEKVPFLLKRDFIQACGVLSLREAEGLIFYCTQHFSTSSEMRIACIRAIQGVGGERLDEMVFSGLRDDDWRVRAVAAKDVQKCSCLIMPSLEAALGDQNYNVRLNAALSLAQKGETGKSALRSKSQSSDRFIREVSKYVLAT